MPWPAAFNLSDSYNLIEAAMDMKTQADENLRVTENRYHASMCPLSESRIAETDYLMATGHLVNETVFAK